MSAAAVSEGDAVRYEMFRMIINGLAFINFPARRFFIRSRRKSFGLQSKQEANPGDDKGCSLHNVHTKAIASTL